ncbi:BTB/POZ and MATH domain-containing protein 2-like protein [Carex littledalei]|uniref:BTB/POZ and MATH domain-containing protein 2-like protein n=1 Tax=Carex littledalei TaxID=544730 RepID=A0A833QJR3_9POAL|nr:BTB/POZ and MATH domain-containing protein 2-like protein [Carex littledalei]
MAVQCLQSRSRARIKSVTHHFEFDYLNSKHLTFDHYISLPFSVGGYDWALDFYPHGKNSDQENDGSHSSLYLTLLTETKDVHAESSFDILDNKGKLVPFREPISGTFTTRPDDCGSWGYPEFISRDKIEACYCKDGMLVISCNIRILSAPSGVDDSSGGLYEDIEKIWEKGEKFDVTFEVEGERISAHRFMLAARSPVFEAELHGPFAESNSICVINIHDMKAEVFKALLRFIYTDDFEPPSDELVQDLFVASDRYNLQMLKAKCQERLWVDLSIENVLPTLILAEQHSSPWLKEKCLEFASKSDNFTQLAITEGYVHMMQSFPSLLVELRKKVIILSDVVTMLKKQRTS